MARYCAIKIDGGGSFLVKSEFRGATINVQQCIYDYNYHALFVVKNTESSSSFLLNLVFT